MNWKDATAVQGAINAGREVERIRSSNRVIVDNLLNGVRPMTDAVAKQIGLHVNANMGEGPVLAAQARRQFTNAFERASRYFKVSIPGAPPNKKFEWEMFVNQFINGKLKKNLKFFNLGNNWRASVVAHGIGPRMWRDKESWLPEYVAIDDLRVPTNTLTSLDNLDWFGRRVLYTESELSRKAFGKNSVKGWNKDAVAKILEKIHPWNYDSNAGNTWINNPERMAEMVRQNGGFYASDAVPVVPMWHFYYKDDESDNERWLMRVVIDQDQSTVGNVSEWVYDSGDESHADEVGQLLSIQYGDMNNTAPFMHSAVRSLGFLLVEPCFWSNMVKCRMLQHLMEQFNTWFRVSDPAGRAKALKIETYDRCVLEEGVSVVPNVERHQVDPRFTEIALAQMKQLQSEASSSYTAQSDSGTSKEQTAYETAVKVSQVNAMMSGMLLVAMRQEQYAYTEICRRFCLRKTGNKDAKRFQELAQQNGIPEIYLNVEMWDIEPEQTLGNGNPTMEMSQAQQLLQMRGLFGPEAQAKILHIATAAITGNAGMAMDLAPVGVAPEASNGEKWAVSIFGTLMQGVPVPNNPDVTALEQIDPMIGMLAAAIHGCEQNGNICTRPQLTGFASVMQYTQGLVQQIATDESQGPVAKQYSQSLGELANILKGFAQRLQEQEAAGQVDQEAQAKIQMMAQSAQVKNQAAEEKSHQSLLHNQAKFEQAQAHGSERHALTQQTVAERHALSQKAAAEKAALEAKVAELEAQVAVGKARVEIATTQAIADSKVKIAEKQANAPVKQPSAPG